MLFKISWGFLNPILAIKIHLMILNLYLTLDWFQSKSDFVVAML